MSFIVKWKSVFAAMRVETEGQLLSAGREEKGKGKASGQAGERGKNEGVSTCGA